MLKYSTAQQRYTAKSTSANNAYWLGKTCREMGDLQNALKYYRRAFELKPASTKYRKAYFSMSASVDAAPQSD